MIPLWAGCPSGRRRGIGTRLFELLLAHVDASVGAACYLTVDPSKAAEVTRYEHLGFTEKRFVPGFYREDEDRFVMTRPGKTASFEAPTSARGRARPARR